MQQVATRGIEAAKNLFQLHGVDAHGQIVLTLVFRTSCIGWLCTSILRLIPVAIQPSGDVLIQLIL
jgi:hypothetical protein